MAVVEVLNLKKSGKKRVSKELEDIETNHMQQLTHLQKLYLEGEIQTNEEYTALQIDLEKKDFG